jgi:hypothetical protein
VKRSGPEGKSRRIERDQGAFWSARAATALQGSAGFANEDARGKVLGNIYHVIGQTLSATEIRAAGTLHTSRKIHSVRVVSKYRPPVCDQSHAAQI